MYAIYYIYTFFNLEIELKPPVESPETLGIDWLFEHTESESESSDMKGNFLHLKFNFNLFYI